MREEQQTVNGFETTVLVEDDAEAPEAPADDAESGAKSKSAQTKQRKPENKSGD